MPPGIDRKSRTDHHQRHHLRGSAKRFSIQKARSGNGERKEPAGGSLRSPRFYEILMTAGRCPALTSADPPVGMLPASMPSSISRTNSRLFTYYYNMNTAS